ncbi:MAG TPA: EthD family reductase [Streptosporangiaceae bacterium]|jgi:uncharacterized protein (TIGR02118 family)|nr:EthD family reductase [Streptosporangiaceae bacterium]
MTVKLVVLYTQPEDTEAFEQHYADTHMPLVDRIPGLVRVETGLVGAAADGGEKVFHRITELYFADPDEMQAGFGSDEGKATAADYQEIEPSGSRMFVVPVDD